MEREIFRTDGSLVVVTIHGLFDEEMGLELSSVDEEGQWTCLSDSEYREVLDWYQKENE